ncbi:MAG: hypothetical protein Q7S22_05485 [Candidatus Micrarchaeota archaeon]|nr:hypothetical protein [Candidatus Micrarchaeota archaeon]
MVKIYGFSERVMFREVQDTVRASFKSTKGKSAFDVFSRKYLDGERSLMLEHPVCAFRYARAERKYMRDIAKAKVATPVTSPNVESREVIVRTARKNAYSNAWQHLGDLRGSIIATGGTALILAADIATHFVTLGPSLSNLRFMASAAGVAIALVWGYVARQRCERKAYDPKLTVQFDISEAILSNVEHLRGVSSAGTQSG